MPRNNTTHDLDIVPEDPKASKPARKPPPAVWPLPNFAPMKINNPLTQGKASILSGIDPHSPYDVFRLFLTDDILQILADNTNKNAQVFYEAAVNKPFRRHWQPTTVKDLRAYIGVMISMGLHHESRVQDFWNEDPMRGPIHTQVSSHIG